MILLCPINYYFWHKGKSIVSFELTHVDKNNTYFSRVESNFIVNVTKNTKELSIKEEKIV